LPSPFLVIATENPIEQEGTFPLPEAQLDRFALRFRHSAIRTRRPRSRSCRHKRHGSSASLRSSRSSLPTKCERWQADVEDIYVDELIVRWTVELVRATRASRGRGARRVGWRGSLALERTAHEPGRCSTERRHVLPEDIDALFLPVLGHRLLLSASFLGRSARGPRSRRGALGLIKGRCLALAPPPRARVGQPAELGSAPPRPPTAG